MRRIIVFLGTLIMPLYAQNPPVPFNDDATELWGFKDAAGKIVIPAVFHHAYEFNGRLAAVLTDEGWRFIDVKGKTQDIRPFIFDNGPDYYEDGLCRFVKDGKVGFLDYKSEIVIAPLDYHFVNAFSDDLAVVCMGCKRDVSDEHGGWKGGTWGFIDKKGKIAIPLQYEMALPFDEGEARVQLGGKWIVIDKSGNVVK
jgi:hypothetical protein